METAGLIIAAKAGAAIFVVGMCYLFIPQAMAASFGLTHLPPQPATAWLRVKGVRDAATGVVAAVLLVVAEPSVVAWCVLAFTLIPVGDAILVLSNGGKQTAAWGIHGSTAVLMMLSVGLILGVS
ncbi:DUF4267 domain-containing protein [Nesterenkonia alkaliphila]|uniref:DUF4267 domain-containing protein n=1 Tax=Nesterenkonia alkaliphila TaxID=1463631 RepID=A0A7K1UIJ5_9MICC|nr:DUF4267 domain-containing protein [Nesterenkonia alkaliphila]MVT26298.1 DUF4267 domain-containing protein [Nesterenkonia alkaliphila]GFZ99213.1 membrane protein [Nesterenkonia alkaliphila]